MLRIAAVDKFLNTKTVCFLLFDQFGKPFRDMDLFVQPQHVKIRAVTCIFRDGQRSGLMMDQHGQEKYKLGGGKYPEKVPFETLRPFSRLLKDHLKVEPDHQTPKNKGEIRIMKQDNPLVSHREQQGKCEDHAKNGDQGRQDQGDVPGKLSHEGTGTNKAHDTKKGNPEVCQRGLTFDPLP
jgi:hypothetical protein